MNFVSNIHISNDFSSICLVTGFGDVTYNSRRGFLGAIPLEGKIAYHLYHIGYSGKKSGYGVKLLRKSKWCSQFSIEDRN